MTGDAFDVRSLQSGVITAVDARSGRSFARHVHDEFGVGLVTGGAQRSWSGRGQVEAVSGNLITVNPEELHDGAPIGAYRSWAMLYFSQAIVSAAVVDLEKGSRSIRELHAPVVDDPRLANLFVAVRMAALHPQGRSAFDERLPMLFGQLFGVVKGSPSVPTGRLSQVANGSTMHRHAAMP